MTISHQNQKGYDASRRPYRVLIVETVVAGLEHPHASTELLDQAVQMVSATSVLLVRQRQMDFNLVRWDSRSGQFENAGRSKMLREFFLPNDACGRPIEVAILCQDSVEISGSAATSRVQKLKQKIRDLSRSKDPKFGSAMDGAVKIDFHLLNTEDFWTQFRWEVDQADCLVWIAPEPSLSKWQEKLNPWKHKLLLPSIDWTLLFQDKLESSSIRSFSLNADTSAFDQPAKYWSLKPKASCGAQDVFQLQFTDSVSADEAASWARNFLDETFGVGSRSENDFILAPWMRGRAFSISMLWSDGVCYFLPLCRQSLQFREVLRNEGRAGAVIASAVEFLGVQLAEYEIDSVVVEKTVARFLKQMAEKKGLCFSGLRGWVGADLVEVSGEEGAVVRYEIVELNGRLTTSVQLFC